jgi:hypothetical protein
MGLNPGGSASAHTLPLEYFSDTGNLVPPPPGAAGPNFNLPVNPVITGNLTVEGSTSLDAGEIFTDGMGDITFNGNIVCQNNILVQTLTVNNPTTLDADGGNPITTDGNGNMSIQAVDCTDLTVENLQVVHNSSSGSTAPVGFRNPNLGTGGAGLIVGLGVPSITGLPGNDYIYLNLTGTPNTHVSPGTLLYQTSNSGGTWTAIL